MTEKVVTARDGFISGVDALYASWFTGIEPDATGRIEVTNELIALLEECGIGVRDGQIDSIDAGAATEQGV